MAHPLRTHPMTPSEDGLPPEADGPARRCIVSRLVLPKERLLRFVIGPDGGVVPDLAADLPGRGVYVFPRRELLDKAVAKNLFAKAARKSVTVPPDLTATVDRLLEALCVDQLGLARRAGQAVAGLEKVKAFIQEGRAAVLVQAADGSEDQRRKVAMLARYAPDIRTGEERALPVFAPLDADTLGRAFGRDHAVHAAVGRGPRPAGAAMRAGRRGLADRLIDDLTRLAQLRGAVLDEPGSGTDHATRGRTG